MKPIKLPKKFISKYPHKFGKGKGKYLCGQRILPKPISGTEPLAELIDRTFLAYNAARLQEGCRLFVEKMLASGNVTVGMSLAGALTPAGLGSAAAAGDKAGRYVSGVNVVPNGTIVITYGRDANDRISTQTLALRPYLNDNFDVVWQCGEANPPAGADGTLSAPGGATSISDKYLPTSCRSQFGGES